MHAQAPNWLYTEAQSGRTAAVEALDFWTRVAPELQKAGKLPDTYVPSFTRLALSYGLMLEAYRTLFVEGASVAAERGNTLKKHPAMQAAADQEAIFRAGCREFGLNPLAWHAQRGAADPHTPDEQGYKPGVLD